METAAYILTFLFTALSAFTFYEHKMNTRLNRKIKDLEMEVENHKRLAEFMKITKKIVEENEQTKT